MNFDFYEANKKSIFVEFRHFSKEWVPCSEKVYVEATNEKRTCKTVKTASGAINHFYEDDISLMLFHCSQNQKSVNKDRWTVQDELCKVELFFQSFGEAIKCFEYLCEHRTKIGQKIITDARSLQPGYLAEDAA